MILDKRLLLLAALVGCSDAPCVNPPCPLPEAVEITVTSSATGAIVHSATISLTGGEVATFPCDGTCRVMGPAGTYTVDVSAPGFVTAHKSFQVKGDNPECGCPSTEVVKTTIALDPVA